VSLPVDSPGNTAASSAAEAAAAAPVTSPDGRSAGQLQAVILLVSSCLAVLGAVLLAPVLPSIERAFAGTPGAKALTPMVLTAPALMVGLTAPFAGRIIDQLGRKRLLVVALVVYAIVGTAPLWLPSLQLIVFSRVLVGLTEAVIMTCCTTLLADYFDGAQRMRYFGLQTVYTSVSATLFFGLGGALGAQNWRTPFWLYAVSLPLAVLAARYLWQPVRQAQQAPTRVLAPFPWRSFSRPLLVTLVGGMVFFVLIVELAFVLDDLGVTSTATIGAISAVASVATAISAYLFARIAHRGAAVTIPLSMGLCGVGIAGMALAPSVAVAVPSAMIAGLGNGLMLPALLTWALSSLSFAQRGRGTGAITGAMFIGQFISPLVVLGLTGILGGLSAAIGVLAVVALLAAASTRAMLGRAALPSGAQAAAGVHP
jgi:MFS family permease